MASAPGEGDGRVAGSRFPMGLRGYETSAVDAHIEALERRLALLVDESRSIGDQIARLEAELAAATARIDGAVEPGATGDATWLVKAMAESLMIVLRSAHEEAATVRNRAEDQAEAILRQAASRLPEADRRAGASTGALAATAPEEASDAGGPAS